ncbi:CBS domain-containing protein [Thermaerobacter subterraneus DSM 13965]|uniref:CBS domain-containing protein n=2 Tax=Thermaerobacter TaxID=73918 RepID=K6Q0T4_9FIRM|nr:CBS domain-containing protein [Thermaerobacter subterraneus DSM 13965]
MLAGRSWRKMKAVMAVNVAFFLLPKSDVVWLSPRNTLRQAMERMEHHRYTAVPLVDDEGRYAGTLTEGDLLWYIKGARNFSFDRAERILVAEVPRRFRYEPVSIYAEVADLIRLAAAQSFVPVVDDRGLFIGIVRRREIIEYCARLLFEGGDAEGAS